jgi:hypothetical protein
MDVDVFAGDFDRKDTPVAVQLPWKSDALQIVETTGGREREILSQIEPGNPPVLHWRLDGQTPAGSTRSYRVLPSDGDSGLRSRPLSVIDEQGKHFEVRQSSRALLRYNYIHPLWTPSGRVVTMDYPPNHHHHRGIWFAWTKTEFEGRHPDFWNLVEATGTVRFAETVKMYSGPVFAGFQVRHGHIDMSSPLGEKEALQEVWDVKVYAVSGTGEKYFIFDLHSTQNCAGSSPLKLLRYRYGGIGFRGSWNWEGKNVDFLTAEGRTRKRGHGTRSRWCDVSGDVDGKRAGVTIHGHPANYRFPQRIRIHPSEPFFNFAPVQSGDMEIVRGQPYVSRYRFVVHDDRMAPTEAERLWLEYAKPPEVRLKNT